ncbi:hypothetical protein CU098_003007, partial [Rhizopus stolonifer]
MYHFPASVSGYFILDDLTTVLLASGPTKQFKLLPEKREYPIDVHLPKRLWNKLPQDISNEAYVIHVAGDLLPLYPRSIIKADHFEVISLIVPSEILEKHEQEEYLRFIAP